MKFECRLPQNGNRIKKEDGVNLSLYAILISTLIVSMLIFSFRVFTVNLYLIKDTVKTGMHIVEGNVITSNRDNTNMGVSTNLKIVSNGTFSTTWDSSGKEKAQVDALGLEFERSFIEYFCLNDDLCPVSGNLSPLSNNDMKVFISSPDALETSNYIGYVTIYEPSYKIEVFEVEDEDNFIIIENEDGTITELPTIEFITEYNIEGWTIYRLSFVRNKYSGCSKTTQTSTPVLHNGRVAKGATIESTTQISFSGIESAFVMLESETPTYSIQITQAQDVILARDDE